MLSRVKWITNVGMILILTGYIRRMNKDLSIGRDVNCVMLAKRRTAISRFRENEKRRIVRKSARKDSPPAGFWSTMIHLGPWYERSASSILAQFPLIFAQGKPGPWREIRSLFAHIFHRHRHLSDESFAFASPCLGPAVAGSCTPRTNTPARVLCFPKVSDDDGERIHILSCTLVRETRFARAARSDVARRALVILCNASLAAGLNYIFLCSVHLALPRQPKHPFTRFANERGASLV